MALISVRSVDFDYPGGFAALREVSLEIDAGEVIALLGSSGAGKSTLARLLNGLLTPTRGSVLVGGDDTRRSSVSKLAKVVGYVFQNPAHQLFATTVEQEMTLGPLAQGWSPIDAKARADELMESFDLGRYRHRHPLALSEGERRRAALAATLAARPKMLILDEPTVGQDSVAKARLGSQIEALAADGHALIIITHDVDFAWQHCSRAVLLTDGRVVADGLSATVLSDSDTLAVARLVPPWVVRLSRAIWPARPVDASLSVRGLREEIAATLRERSRLLDTPGSDTRRR